jgi:hypothetical protein
MFTCHLLVSIRAGKDIQPYSTNGFSNAGRLFWNILALPDVILGRNPPGAM